MNILGLEIQRADGKTNWQDIRRVFYVALITWVIGVRFLNLDPFKDLVSGHVTLGTGIDALCLYGIWLLVWHVLWAWRPRIG